MTNCRLSPRQPSDFGTFDLENVRAWPKTVEIRVRVDFEMAELSAGNSFPSPARGEWSEDGERSAKRKATRRPRRFQLELGASGRERLSQHGMIATMQVPKAI